MLGTGILLLRLPSPQLRSRAVPLCRRALSSPTGTTSKDARLERMKRMGAASAPNKGPIISARGLAGVASCFALGYAIFDIKQNKDGMLGKLYYGSPLNNAMNWLYDQTFGSFSDAFLPTSEALLPTWPTDPYYAQVPPGTPVPPLLVLDLEKTAIGSEYDARYGWRHVKRPGLDKFIQQLSTYYEIVIFSENDVNVQEQLLLAIDKENRCFKLGPNAAELRNNVYLKRLDYMNRDIRKIVLIDDNPQSSSLFPRNTLLVKPFTDLHDKTDTELVDLIPLLQALVHEQCEDYRDTFDALGTHDASEIAAEYQMRIAKKKRVNIESRNKGLGGIARAMLAPNKTEPSESPRTSLIPSATQLVGGVDEVDYSSKADRSSAASSDKADSLDFKGKLKTDIGSSAPKQKGKLFEVLGKIEKDNEEMENLRKEKMNEIYARRMMGGK